MTTAAMMRASTATNAPATDVIGAAVLATGGGVVLIDATVVVGGVVADVVVGGVLGVSVSKEENIIMLILVKHNDIISQMHTK